MALHLIMPILIFSALGSTLGSALVSTLITPAQAAPPASVGSKDQRSTLRQGLTTSPLKRPAPTPTPTPAISTLPNKGGVPLPPNSGTPAPGSTPNSKYAKIMEKFAVSYFGFYSGGAITGPFYRESLNTNTGEMNDVQSVDNTFSLGFKPIANVTVGGSYRFVWIPSVGPGQGMDFVNKDPWLSVKHSKLINAGPFNLSADLRAYIPVASSLNNYTAFRSTQNASLEIPNTKFTLGAFAFERINIVKNVAPGVTRGTLAYSMFGTYQFHPKVGATLWTDMVQWDIVEGEELSNALSNLSVGVSWDILPNLNINPTLFVLPKTMTLQSTCFVMSLSAKIL